MPSYLWNLTMNTRTCLYYLIVITLFLLCNDIFCIIEHKTHKSSSHKGSNEERTLHVAVIAPEDERHQFSLSKILPPIMLAVQGAGQRRKHKHVNNNHRSLGMEWPLTGWKVEVHHADSMCSSTAGPLSAFDFYTSNHAGKTGTSYIYRKFPRLCESVYHFL